MRQKIWILLLCLLSAIAIMVVIGDRPHSPIAFDPPSGSLSQPPVDPVSPRRVQTRPLNLRFMAAPAVVPDRLMADLEALAFDRSTPEGREESREYIRSRLMAAGWTPQSQPFPGGINIIAKKPGRNPEAGSLLLGAHYDTVPGSAGASDNGSGVAVLLEVARLLPDWQTERSLELAFFDLEEIGLQGSLAFATEQNLVADLRGVIVVDMVGYACYQAGCQDYPQELPIPPPSERGDFVAVIGDTEHLPLLEVFEREETEAKFPLVYTLPVPFKGLLFPDTLRSDHAPFWYQGIGAVLVTDTGNLRSPHYHEPSDTPQEIDRAFFIGSAQRIADATVTLLESQGSLETHEIRTETNFQR